MTQMECRPVSERERAEDFTKECLALLTEGNRLASTHAVSEARRTCKTIRELLECVDVEADVSEFYAMLKLLEANIKAYSSGTTSSVLGSLRFFYQEAHEAAEAVQSVLCLLYVLRARRAEAAVLAHYGACVDTAYGEAKEHLLAILTALQSKDKALQGENHESLRLQTTVQLAEVEALTGSPEQALAKLRAALTYPEGDARIHRDYLEGLVLQARLLWQTGSRREARQLAKRVIREAERLDPEHQQRLTNRVQLLKGWLGFRRYEQAHAQLHCPRL